MDKDPADHQRGTGGGSESYRRVVADVGVASANARPAAPRGARHAAEEQQIDEKEVEAEEDRDQHHDSPRELERFLRHCQSGHRRKGRDNLGGGGDNLWDGEGRDKLGGGVTICGMEIWEPPPFDTQKWRRS